jgi:hypothetical protein
MKVELEYDQCEAVTVDTLRGWYEDAIHFSDLEDVSSMILEVLRYSMVDEEYEEWLSSLQS